MNAKSIHVLVPTGLYPPEIGGPATYSKFLKDDLPRYGITVSVLPFREVRKYPVGLRHIIFCFQVFVHGRSADVIYAQDTFSVGIPSALAALFLGKKFLVRVPGDHVWEQGTRRFGYTLPLEEMPAFSWKWHPAMVLMRVLQRWVITRADILVVPSRYMEKIVRGWGVPQEKIHRIYNGVEEFVETGNKEVLRGLLRFEGTLIISVGRLVPWKGFRGLIRMMPNLKKILPGAKLLIIGSGPDLSSLEESAKELGIENDVIFGGEVEREVLIRYIRASDVFVLNSRYEGLSHQLLEVMSVGIPAVVTNVGGNPEVIQDKVNGFLVKPDDSTAIHNAIVGLVKDTALRASIVQSAKKSLKRFSNEDMVKATAALIKTLRS